MKGFLNKVSGGATKPTGKAGMNESGGVALASNGIESTPRADISLPKSQARRFVESCDLSMRTVSIDQLKFAILC